LARGSTARHAAIGLIALTAILWQGFVATLAPVESFDARGNIICSEPQSDRDEPSNTGRHEHSACCILACAASGVVFLAAVVALVVFPAPRCARVAISRNARNHAPSPLKLYFAARGPPLAV
jgi:hypothetical protein